MKRLGDEEVGPLTFSKINAALTTAKSKKMVLSSAGSNAKGRCANLIISPIFPNNYMKMEKNGSGGELSLGLELGMLPTLHYHPFYRSLLSGSSDIFCNCNFHFFLNFALPTEYFKIYFNANSVPQETSHLWLYFKIPMVPTQHLNRL